jgi:hypothetical protein
MLWEFRISRGAMEDPLEDANDIVSYDLATQTFIFYLIPLILFYFIN